jgi:hypothetical protein
MQAHEENIMQQNRDMAVERTTQLTFSFTYPPSSDMKDLSLDHALQLYNVSPRHCPAEKSRRCGSYTDFAPSGKFANGTRAWGRGHLILPELTMTRGSRSD